MTKLGRAMQRGKLGDAEVARLAGLHRTQVWRYRTGRNRPNLDNAARLLRACARLNVEVHLRDLIGGER